MNIVHVDQPKTPGEYSISNGAASISLPLTICLGTGSHAIYPFDHVRRWGEYELTSFPPLTYSPITLIAPLNFAEGTQLVRKLFREDVLPSPIVTNSKISFQMSGEQWRTRLSRKVQDCPIFESIIATHSREEITRHLSL